MNFNEKKHSWILIILFVLLQNLLFAQYGLGVDGTTTFAGTSNLSLTKTNVTAVAGATITVSSSAGFSAGNEILIIQMNGFTGNQGNWEQLKVLSVSGSNITLASALSKTYDPATAQVQLLKLPQYDNVTVSGTLSTDAWNGINGGVLAFMVKNDLTFSGAGKLDMTVKGFAGSIGGFGGAGGFGATAGTNGDPGNPAMGIGTGGTGIFGGGNGSANGSAGISGVAATLPTSPGAAIPATNASVKSTKQYLMGSGGSGGNGGAGNTGGGAGGGGSNQPSTATAGTSGTDGGAGGSGGNGGNGGVGGGLILIFAKNFVSSGVNFCVNGGSATDGTAGTNGGAGGNGGTGGGRQCNGKGGGAGGGNGANGGGGGDGGNGGAAGFVYLKKETGTLTAAMIQKSGGTSGNGGAGGDGGFAGVNGGDASPSCLPCGPTTSVGSAGCGSAGALLAGLNFIDGQANSTYIFGGYRIWSSIPGVGVGMVQAGSLLTDCQGAPYYAVQMGQNFTPGGNIATGTQYILVSSTATNTTSLEAYLTSFFSNPPSTTGGFNDVSFTDGAGNVWIQQCYAGICGARTAPSPGLPGTPGSSGGGTSADGDFDSETVAALPIELIAFSGEKQSSNTVKLTWETASEVNFEGFEIQRSFDAINFEKIAFVNGKGKSERGVKYIYNDNVSGSGTQYFYYRLKEIDKDKTSVFSKTIVLRNEKNSSLEETLVLSPVPVEEDLLLNFYHTNSEICTVEILNINGQILLSQQILVENGQNKDYISLKKLQSGVYFIKITDEAKQTQVAKMFVKK
jgi:hypothetical protein